MQAIQMRLEVTMPERISSCAFTGHRKLEEDFNAEAFEHAFSTCLQKGCKTFYSGMAAGFDLYAAERVLKEKEKNQEIKLIACIPHERQSQSFLAEDKKRYDSILKKVDEKKVISEEYTKWCMARRNEYMADRADVLIAYLNKDTGGTAYTVKYFKRKQKGFVFYIF